MCKSDHAKLSPVEIEGNGILFDVVFEDVLELVEGDRSRAVTVENLSVPRGHRRTEGGETIHTRRNTGMRRSNPRQASSATSRTPQSLPKTPNHAWRYPRHGTRWRTGFDRFSSNPRRERWP